MPTDDDIRRDIKEINEKLTKLAKHIDFVEDTYTVLRNPISFVCSRLMGQKQKLPEISDKEK